MRPASGPISAADNGLPLGDFRPVGAGDRD
jgi:hypothetical protein